MINRILIIFSIITFFIVFYTCDNPVDSTGNSLPKYELFPLKKGNSYYYTYEYTKFGTLDNYIDSGYVKYDIIDSTHIIDTLVVWIIKETQHLHFINATSRFEPPISYTIDTTITYSLLENLNNDHELQCNSLVWKFPFVDSSFFYPSWTKIGPYKIYRYSNNDNYDITYKKIDGVEVLSDTLTFNENKGLTYYRRDYHEPFFLSGYEEILKIRLVQ